MRGRISALLELGSGFNPQFSGRENVFLTGAILGISRSEIETRFERIIAFADIGDYIDQPVKTYSSGMFARLSFAVAIHTEPDILIVDEALSVGDEAFQRKCFARIHEIKERGGTILFVSHAAQSVVQLCDHALFLDRGELLLRGAPKQVVAVYQKFIYAPAGKIESLRKQIIDGKEIITNERERLTVDPPLVSEVVQKEEPGFDPNLVPKSTLAYERHGAEIEDAHLETEAGRRVNVLVHGEAYIYTYQVMFSRSASAVTCGMQINSTSGLAIGGATTGRRQNAVPYVESGSKFRVKFRFRCLLNPGTYFLNAGVGGTVGDVHTYLDRRIDVAMFRVKPVADLCATGMVDFDVSPSLEQIALA